MAKQIIKEDTNRYTLKWNGKVQPIGANSFHSVKMYIESSLRQGGCNLWQFEIFTQWGQLKTNIVNDKNADPTLLTNYFKLYQ
jgi:hypothetical protein